MRIASEGSTPSSRRQISCFLLCQLLLRSLSRFLSSFILLTHCTNGSGVSFLRHTLKLLQHFPITGGSASATPLVTKALKTGRDCHGELVRRLYLTRRSEVSNDGVQARPDLISCRTSRLVREILISECLTVRRPDARNHRRRDLRGISGSAAGLRGN